MLAAIEKGTFSWPQLQLANLLNLLMGKLVAQAGLFSLGLVLEKESLKFKSVVCELKIDLVLYPASSNESSCCLSDHQSIR